MVFLSLSRQGGDETNQHHCGRVSTLLKAGVMRNIADMVMQGR